MPACRYTTIVRGVRPRERGWISKSGWRSTSTHGTRFLARNKALVSPTTPPPTTRTPVRTPPPHTVVALPRWGAHWSNGRSNADHDHWANAPARTEIPVLCWAHGYGGEHRPRASNRHSRDRSSAVITGNRVAGPAKAAGGLSAVELHVSLVGRNNLTTEIYRQLRDAILAGRLPAGERLPPTRELARQLSVSRGTVTLAYEQLAGEGYVGTRVGAGTFVSDHIGSATGQARPAGGALRPRPVWASVPIPARRPLAEFHFRSGIPDARLFPYARWRRLLGQELHAGATDIHAYSDPAGHQGLRQAIALHFGVSRAVRATAEDIVVTSGTQQAVDLIARVILGPGDVAAVEDPGYSPPRRLLASLGAQVAGVPVDAEGLVVDAIPANARLVYVSPSHQFPLGVTMSLPRRLALLAPAPLRTALRAAKFVTDWHTHLPAQAALARFIADGWFARHIRSMRTVYAERHQLVTDGLRRQFAGHLEVIPSAIGLHLAATARTLTTAQIEEALSRAAITGVDAQPLAPFGLSAPGPPGLVIGYGAIPTDRIPEGLHRLRLCFDDR